MLGRLIRKFLLALSVLLAIALIALALSSRRNDWVISTARNGTYHEVRSDRGRVGYTQIAGWPGDQTPKLGNPNSPKTAPPTIVLLDNSSLTLTPNKKGWWPPLKEDGSAMQSSPLTTALSLPSTQPISNITISGSTLLVSNASIPPGATTRSTVTIMPATTMPASNFRLAGGGTLSLSGASTNSTITSGSSTLTFTGNLFIMFKPYTYVRYSIPHALLIAVVLTPVWVALLITALRWRRRATRRRRGLCIDCGYDLRGSPAGGACPECGNASGDAVPVLAT